MNITIYYSILGVKEGAGPDELKRAYRQKAKQLHPDRNTAEDAHEQFILLTEAYEYLINFGNIKSADPIEQYTNWQKNERAEARSRAEAQARMEYEAFIQTDFYKSLIAVETLLTAIMQLVLLIFLIAIPVILAVLYSIPGFVAGIAVLAVTAPVVVNIFQVNDGFNLSRLGKAMIYLAKRTEALLVGLAVFNLIVFFRIGMQTFISLWLLLQLYCLAMLLIFGYLHWKKQAINKFRKLAYSFCFGPVIISVLLCYNFVLSGYPRIESYTYNYWVETNNGLRPSTLITLENIKYDEYTGIRCFVSIENLKGKSTVFMLTEEGALGLKVAKWYTFE